MKRFLSLCITLVMLVTLAVPAGAVEDKTATTIRLESTQGTVTVKNAAGTDVKLQSKMRLNDGYSVATKAKSYAYISLDTDRSIKLDASSEVSVAKNGKKLEIAVKTGSIFFDVKNSLSSTEKLNIRTSTMVTGVRGTSGVVTAIDRAHSTIMLLEGQVLVTSFNEDMIRMDSMMVYAGELAYTQPSDLPDDDGTQLLKRKFNESEVPGFAAVEVAKSKDLQNRIDTLTPLESAKIIGDAEQRLAADEAAAQQAAQRVEELLKQQEVEFVDPVFQSEEPVTGGGGGGGSTAPSTTFNLDNPTEQQIMDALADPQYTTVNVTNAGQTDGGSLPIADGGLNVPAGKTLNLNSGNMTNGTNSTVNGTVNVAAGSTLTNSDTLNVNSTNSIHVKGTLENQRILNIGNGTAEDAGLVEISGTGELVCGTDAEISVADGSTLTVSKLTLQEPELNIPIASGGNVSIKAQTDMTVAILEPTYIPIPAVSGTHRYTNNTADEAYMQVSIDATVHTMTLTPGTGYTIAPYDGSNTVTHGADFSFTVTPDTGYMVTTVSDGTNTLTPADGVYTISNVTSDMTITVTVVQAVRINVDTTNAFGGYQAVFMDGLINEGDVPADVGTFSMTLKTADGTEDLPGAGKYSASSGFYFGDAKLHAVVTYAGGTRDEMDFPQNPDEITSDFKVTIPDNATAMDLKLTDVEYTFANDSTTNATDLQAALKDPAIVAVTVGSNYTALDADLTVPAGKTLVFEARNFNIQSVITNNGTVHANASVYIYGRYIGNADSTFEATSLYGESGGDFTLDGNASMEISQNAALYGGTDSATYTVGTDATFTCRSLNISGNATYYINNGTTIINREGTQVANGGTLINNGTLTANMTDEDWAGYVFSVAPESTLNNTGVMTVSGASILVRGGTFNNSGTITADQTMTLSAEVNESGTLENGTFKMNGGTFTSTATDNAIELDNGVLNITGGSITSDTASHLIHITSASILELYGGELHANGTDCFAIYDDNARAQLSVGANPTFIYCERPNKDGVVNLGGGWYAIEDGDHYILTH